MIGTAGVSSPLTRQLHQRTRSLARRFTDLTWTWVPRSENRHADRLSRRSFHYLRYSHQFHRKLNWSRLSSSERLVPLVDLRIHAPVMQAGNHLTIVEGTQDAT